MYIIILILLFRYKYCRKPSDDWRHETQCHGYLLLLITSYIHHIYIYIYLYIYIFIYVYIYSYYYMHTIVIVYTDTSLLYIYIVHIYIYMCIYIYNIYITVIGLIRGTIDPKITKY